MIVQPLCNRINIPVCDIHEKQARSQIIENLHSLANVTSAISQRQMQKCQEQTERIKVLGQRIHKCKDQISHVSNLKTAVTFVTPSQYPSHQLELEPDHLSDLYQHSRVTRFDPAADFKMKHDIQSFGKDSKVQLNNMHECVGFILDQLRMKPKGILQKGKKEGQIVDNYGNIPSTLKYLDSLSVFNTTVNPYRKFSIENNLFKVEKRSKLSKENLPPIMSDYLSNFDRTRNVEKVDRYVQPNLWIDPSFDLSLDLENAVDIDGVEIEEKNVMKEEIKREISEIKEAVVVKMPVVDVKENAPIKIEEKEEIKALNLVIPQIMPNLILPIPPKLDLPAPPPPDIPLLLPIPPKLQLPIPQLPKIDLNPPPLSRPALIPFQIPAERGNLLEQIKNAKSKLKLKPTITKQSGGVKGYAPKEVEKQPEKTNNENNSYDDMISALKRRKQRRRRALHPDDYSNE